MAGCVVHTLHQVEAAAAASQPFKVMYTTQTLVHQHTGEPMPYPDTIISIPEAYEEHTNDILETIRFEGAGRVYGSAARAASSVGVDSGLGWGSGPRGGVGWCVGGVGPGAGAGAHCLPWLPACHSLPSLPFFTVTSLTVLLTVVSLSALLACLIKVAPLVFTPNMASLPPLPHCLPHQHDLCSTGK